MVDTATAVSFISIYLLYNYRNSRSFSPKYGMFPGGSGALKYIPISAYLFLAGTLEFTLKLSFDLCDSEIRFNF